MNVPICLRLSHFGGGPNDSLYVENAKKTRQMKRFIKGIWVMKCQCHASAMPIGVGRHHQTDQSQTQDLTERIADALVSAMCLCIFGKAKRKRL